jgi:hypothetical protein
MLLYADADLCMNAYNAATITITIVVIIIITMIIITIIIPTRLQGSDVQLIYAKCEFLFILTVREFSPPRDCRERDVFRRKPPQRFLACRRNTGIATRKLRFISLFIQLDLPATA